MDYQLVFPMAFYVFYIWLVLGFSTITRWKAVGNKTVKIKVFKTYQTEGMTEKVIVRGRHFDNQFQLPMLFLITCLVRMQVGAVGIVPIYLAWGFVLSRVCHSFVHLGSNNVIFRAIAYAFGWLSVNVMWIEILIHIIK